MLVGTQHRGAVGSFLYDIGITDRYCRYHLLNATLLNAIEGSTSRKTKKKKSY